MITDLRIENFKSFGSGMRPLALQPLNFIVGANASGKTNLISALRFLKIAMLQSVEVAANDFGGCAEVRNKILHERDKPKPLRITLRVKMPAARIRSRQGPSYSISSYRYCVEIDLKGDDGVPVILTEELKAELTIREKEPGTFELKRTRDHFTVVDPLTGSDGRKRAVEEDDKARLVAGSSFIGPVVGRFRRFIERWAFFNINPEVVRQASKDIFDPDLGEAGESLSDNAVRGTRQKARAARAFHVCIAIKEIESWFLADTTAIQAVMPGCEWEAPAETRTAAKGRLRALYKTHFGKLSSFNGIAFAKDIAPKFSPTRALPRSASFRYFWGILDQRIRE